MTVEHLPFSFASKCAIALLALLSFGPLVTALDLLFHFLPTNFPAIQNLRAASFIGRTMWVSSGVLGAVSICLMVRSPVLAIAACSAFAAVYIAGANAVWRHFTFGCWFALAIVVLSILGARTRVNPVRGSL